MIREDSNEVINEQNSVIGTGGQSVGQPGGSTGAQTGGQSGVSKEDFEKARMLAEEIGFSKDSGIELLELEEGYCKGRIVIRNRHLNPLNTVHGGVFFTLADTICGIAAASTGHGGPTVQGDMDYLRAVRGKEIVCTARVTKTGKTLTWVDGVVTDDTGREVAHTKFIYYRLKEARHFGFKSKDD